MGIKANRGQIFPKTGGGVERQTVSQGNTQYLDTGLTIFGLTLLEIDADLTYNFINGGEVFEVRLKKGVNRDKTVISSNNISNFFDVRSNSTSNKLDKPTSQTGDKVLLSSGTGTSTAESSVTKNQLENFPQRITDLENRNSLNSVGNAPAGGSTEGAAVAIVPLPGTLNTGDYLTIPAGGQKYYIINGTTILLNTGDRLIWDNNAEEFIINPAGGNQIASEVPLISISEDEDHVAVPDNNVQGAVDTLSQEVKKVDNKATVPTLTGNLPTTQIAAGDSAELAARKLQGQVNRNKTSIDNPINVESNGEANNTTEQAKSSFAIKMKGSGNWVNLTSFDNQGNAVYGPVRNFEMNMINEGFVSGSNQPNNSWVIKARETDWETAEAFLAITALRTPITAGSDRTFFVESSKRLGRASEFVIDRGTPNEEVVKVKNHSYVAPVDRYIADFTKNHSKGAVIEVIEDIAIDVAPDGTFIWPQSDASVIFNIQGIRFGHHNRAALTGFGPFSGYYGTMAWRGFLGGPYQTGFNPGLEVAVPRITVASGEFYTYSSTATTASDVYDRDTANATITLAAAIPNLAVGDFVILGNKSSRNYQMCLVKAVSGVNITIDTQRPTPTGTYAVTRVASFTCSTQATTGTDRVLTLNDDFIAGIVNLEVGFYIWIGQLWNGQQVQIKAINKSTNEITVDLKKDTPTGTYAVMPYQPGLNEIVNSRTNVRGTDEFLFQILNQQNEFLTRFDARNNQIVFGKKMIMQFQVDTNNASNTAYRGIGWFEASKQRWSYGLRFINSNKYNLAFYRFDPTSGTPITTPALEVDQDNGDVFLNGQKAATQSDAFINALIFG